MTHGADRRRATRTRAKIFASRGVTLLSLLALAACVRTQPPAPVDDRTGAYTRTPRPPVASTNAAGQAPVANAPVSSAPKASAPVSTGRNSSGSISSAPLDAPPPAHGTSVPPPTASTPPPSTSAPYSSPNATMVWPPPPPSSAIPQSSASPAPVAGLGTPNEVTVQVAPGQTLYAIAREHNVPVRALIDINNLDPPYALRSGQRIRVPMLPTHTVGEGETLTTLSRRYGVGVRSLAETNHIEPPYRIVPGTRLLIPRAAVEEPVATSSPDHVLRAPPSVEGTAPTAPPPNPDHVLRLPPDVASSTAPAQPPPATEMATLTPPPLPPPSTRNLPSRRGFLWPIHGPIASPFGPKPGGAQNDGINITAKRGTSVHAAEDGVVVYAGNELRGYGNLILIRHAGGWTTAYAHNDELLVGRGAHVKRGQVISKVGGTGGVSSPQLHFELRQSGRPVDPVAVMGPMS